MRAFSCRSPRECCQRGVQWGGWSRRRCPAILAPRDRAGSPPAGRPVAQAALRGLSPTRPDPVHSGEQPGEPRDDFRPDLSGPPRTPSDLRNAQVLSLPMEAGPLRTSSDAVGPQAPPGWRFDPARLHHALPMRRLGVARSSARRPVTPGEQRDDFGVDLPGPQRTPTDFKNAQRVAAWRAVHRLWKWTPPSSTEYQLYAWRCPSTVTPGNRRPSAPAPD
jgi:hypothetical protein